MTGPSDSSVQAEALKPCPFCGKCPQLSHFAFGGVPFWSVRCCRWETHRKRSQVEAIDAGNRRAALPVAPSDADRELMQEALALISWHCFGECRVMPGPLPIAANIAAALRTRLLRHSEGKE